MGGDGGSTADEGGVFGFEYQVAKRVLQRCKNGTRYYLPIDSRLDGPHEGVVSIAEKGLGRKWGEGGHQAKVGWGGVILS